MELVSDFPLLKQQTTALIKKNYLLTLRNRRAMFMQIFSSFFFMALLCGIEQSLKYQAKQPTVDKEIIDPKPITTFTIPPCESKLFLKRPCFDFVWSGNDSQTIQSIVKKIMENNPGRPISPDKVKSFKTEMEVITWLENEPNHVPGVLNFQQTNMKEIRYTLQTNTSSYRPVTRHFEDPLFKYLFPLQLAASREIARSIIQDPNFSWDISLSQFAHPKIETKNEGFGWSINLLVPIIIYAASIFGFIFQTSSLVHEKELKLRQAMTMMGLYDTAYWSSWLIWEAIISFISSTFIAVCGFIFRIDVFTKNNFMIGFILFFLFQLSMVGLAFMLSVLMNKASTATSMSFGVVLIGLILGVFSDMIFQETTKKILQIICSMIPPSPFYKGLFILSDASQQGGLKWSNISECSDCFSMMFVYKRLGLSFIFWFLLALYFDNVLPNKEGVRKSIFYFLTPTYWSGRGKTTFEEQQSTLPPSENKGVSDEEELVKQQAKIGFVDPDVSVQLRGLAKTYPKSTKIKCRRCCFSFQHQKPFEAVKGLWLNLAKDQLFCLLGPNGAGKTTTIGCLTGIIPVTGGDALIYGNSIRTPASMSNIRRMTGVCTQYDTLWEKLSAQEHLEIFSCIKGLTPYWGKLEARKLIGEVKLTDAANVRSGSYSGGMKRRLSVAISLIGDPKLVILDEPTTGMDPVTRRHVWDVIESAKIGRSIILTTHSMEEADILSDRIGIMAKGRLRCIGTSTMLKSQFGAGFIVKLSFYHNDQVNDIEAVKRFFAQRLNVSPIEDSKPLTFEISNEKEGLLEEFFEELENRESEFGISNIQIGLTTLEEVFLNIAQQAELETPTAQDST